MKLTFKSKLLIYSLLLSTLPLVLLGMLASKTASDSIQGEVDRHNQTLLRQMRIQMDAFLTSIDHISMQLATNRDIEQSVKVGPSMKRLDETWAMKDAILKARISSEYKFDISLLYEDYGLVYSNRYGLIKVFEFPFLGIVRDTETRFNGPVLIPPDPDTGRNELLLIRPTPVFKKPSSGILVMHVSLEKLILQMNSFDAGQGRNIYIIDKQGTIVASNTEQADKLPGSLIEHLFFQRHPNKVHIYTDEARNQFQVSMMNSAYSDWSYVVMTPLEGLINQSRSISILTWGMAAGLTVLWICIAIFVSNRLYVPIKRLSTKYLKQSQTSVKHDDGLIALEDSFQHLMVTKEELEKQWNNSLPMIKENVLLRLIWGMLQENEIGNKQDEYRLHIKGQWFYVFLIECEQFAEKQEKYSGRDLSLYLFAFRKMIDEMCEMQLERETWVIVTPQPGQTAVIIGTENAGAETEERLGQLARTIRDTLHANLKSVFTVAASSPRKGWSGIPASFQESLGLLRLKILLGPGVTISQKEVEPSAKKAERLLIKRLKTIASEVVRGETGRATMQLNEFVEELPRYVRHPESVQGLFAYLIGEISSHLQEMDIHDHDIFKQDLYKRLYGMTSVMDMRTWLSDEVFSSIRKDLELRNDSKLLIAKVLNYIHEHFDTGLSLQKLADEFGLHPSQLSRMFKVETNINFGDYLIRYRMDKAKLWLENTEMSVKTIAERLQYTTVQNFTRTFKQVMGVPPATYREQSRNDI